MRSWRDVWRARSEGHRGRRARAWLRSWNSGGGGKSAVAGRVKVMDLAKELGVTSKDLVVALEGMGQKSMRATSPLTVPIANELRIKLGRGRDLPTETKPKRAAKLKATPSAEDAADVAAPPRKAEAAKEELVAEPAVETIKPAATIFRPSAAPAAPADVAPAPAQVAPPAAPPVVAQAPPAPPIAPPKPAPMPAPAPVIPVRPA